MNPRRSATVAAAFYPAFVLAGWAVVNLASPAAPPRTEAASTARIADRLAPSLAANVDAAMALPKVTAAGADIKPAEPAAVEAEQKLIVLASVADPTTFVLPEMQSMQSAIAGTAEPPQEMATTRKRIEIVGECLDAAPCIDQYLYALYERTPKEDTIKETEKRKVTVKRKGKVVTVTRSFTKLVENDFTWKDPHAAERTGMSMSDYVIGGMDKRFKLKLFYLLQAAEDAGLQPGITSAFRDDYRQSIASGLKAAANRSYHGGSLRGGYGHGLAADIVSVNGANRAQRWKSTEALWKWVDANGKQYGIGRPYLAFDPPHVGPIDGPEYASRRGGSRAASTEAKKRPKQATQGGPAASKRLAAAKPPGGKPTARLAEAR